MPSEGKGARERTNTRPPFDSGKEWGHCSLHMSPYEISNAADGVNLPLNIQSCVRTPIRVAHWLPVP